MKNTEVLELNKKHTRRRNWLRVLGVLMCITVFITTYALILPAVTMDTSDPSVTRINWGGIEWDDTNNVFHNISIVLNTQKDTTYTLQYSDDNGVTWTAVSGVTYVSQKPGEQTGYTLIGQSASLDTLFQSAPMTRRYRVYGKANKTEVKTASCGFLDLLEVVKPGFREWVAGDYLTEFGGLNGTNAAPSTKADYLTAFDDYYHVPSAEITVSTQTSESAPVTAAVAVKDMSGTVLSASAYTYQWQYYDESGDTPGWKDITGANAASYSVSPSASAPIPFGGAQVRCVVRDASDGSFVTRSEAKLLNPQQYRFSQTYGTLDTALGLNSVYSTNGAAFDFTHASAQWDWAYFDAVAKDPGVPFYDKDSYWNFLCKTYLTAYDKAKSDGKSDTEAGTAAAAAAKAEWDYYIYDIIDPAAKNTNYGTYYTTGTFGDKNLKWVKTNDNDDSFHYTPKTNPGPGEGLILPLNYDYLDGGVDYDSFIRDMSKYAEADAAGDGNTERKYNVDMAADAHAQVKAPIVILFQVQTSWQMFDLEHANALAGEGGTEVGAVANNTELATLYDVKHAMLDFINYIDEKYPGNNLVLGVTEVRHGGSDSMFNTTFTSSNGSKGSLYVSNNPDVLYDAVTSWDVFGNCEHVHYDNNTLTAAVGNLGIDLSDFRDKNGSKISYSDIRKAVVIIGGPTENKDSTNGYNCILPWSSFASADIDSVYGIRVNDGTSLAGNTASGTPILSWMDNDGNNTGVYKDGNGAAGFTEKYVCTTRQMLYDTFVKIAEQELAVGGLDILDTNANVDDVVLTDTVRNEFQLDLDKPFRITVTPDLNNGRGFTAVADLQAGTVKNAAGTVIGTVTKTGTAPDTYTITYSSSPGTDPHPTQIVLTSNADGTTKVEVKFNKLYNTQKAEVNFGIQAKEGYIGSNNVFTNVGLPTTAYTHVNSLTGQSRDYTRLGTDKPQVNVPIDFTTVNGTHKVLYRDTSGTITYDISLNDADDIPASVQGLVDDFGQINGSLVYKWLLPDGTTTDPVSTKVTGGKVQGGFPDLSEDYTFTSDGFFSAQLLVTFEPDDVDPKGEFHDVKTKTEVTEKTRSGAVTFQVVSPNTKQKLTVKKTWVGSGTPPDSITFKLKYEDGDGVEQYYKESGSVREFVLTGDSDPAWTGTFDIIPTPDGSGSVYEYTAVEAEVEGYSSSIEFSVDSIYEYEASVNAYFTPQIPNSGAKVVVHYKYKGVDYTSEFTGETLTAGTTWNKILAEELPTEADGTPYAAVITRVDYVSGTDTYTVFKNDIDPYACTVTQVGYPVFTLTTGSANGDKIDKGKIVRVDYTVGGTTYHTYHKLTSAVAKSSSFTITGTTLLPPGTAVTNVAAYWGNNMDAQNNAVSSAVYSYLGMRKQNVTFKTPIALAENKTVEITLKKVVPAGQTAPEYAAEYTVPKNGLAQGSTIDFEFPDVLPDGEYYLSDLVYKVDQNTANDVHLKEKTTVTFTTPLALADNKNQVRVTLSNGATAVYTPPNAGLPIGSKITVEFAGDPASGTTVTAIDYKSGANWLPLTAQTRLDITTPLTLAQNTVVTATLYDNTANKTITATYTVGKNEGAAGTVLHVTDFKEGNAAATLDYTHNYTVRSVTYKPNGGTASPLATPGAVTFTVPYKSDNTVLNIKKKEVTLTVKNGATVIKTIKATVEDQDHKSGTSLTLAFAEPVPDNDAYTYELSVKMDNANIYAVDEFSVSCGGTLADAFLTVGGMMPDAALYIGGALPDNKVTSSGFNTISATMDITEGVSMDTGVTHTVYYVDEKTGKTGSFTAAPVISGTTATFTNPDPIPAGEYTVTNITRMVGSVEVPYYNDLNAYLKTGSMLTNITASSVCGITNTPAARLPSTGGFGPSLYVMTGFGIMSGSIIYGAILRRKRERRYTD